MLSDIFVTDDRKQIESIHLAKNSIKDTLIWSEHESGIFSVTSMYWLAKRKKSSLTLLEGNVIFFGNGFGTPELPKNSNFLMEGNSQHYSNLSQPRC